MEIVRNGGRTSTAPDASATGPLTALVKQIENALVVAATNYWSSTENNANNAWNLNANSGNINNNNKYNGNRVRPVSAPLTHFQLTVVHAFLMCRKHKGSSVQYREFLSVLLKELAALACDIWRLTYTPTTSTTFCVDTPKLREIFAAAFIDRNAQHWCTDRLEPLFEELFIRVGDTSYNCRKGYGTLRAVEKLRDNMMVITDGWTKSAVVSHLDIKSFFMSLDRRLMLVLIIPFIATRYQGRYREYLIWLTASIIMHNPQDDCVRKGRLHLWDGLPKEKSLFDRPQCPPLPKCVRLLVHFIAPGFPEDALDHLIEWADNLVISLGMPIGNITTQLLANFFMAVFDYYAYNLCRRLGGLCIRFVDDITPVMPDVMPDSLHHRASVKPITFFRQRVTAFLDHALHLSLHPNKSYIQPATRGVQFVGSVITPYGTFPIHRTRASFARSVETLDDLCADILRRQAPALYTQMTQLQHRRRASTSDILSLVEANRSVRIPISSHDMGLMYHALASVNSLLGLLKHGNNYYLRLRVLLRARYLWWFFRLRADHSALLFVKRHEKSVTLESVSEVLHQRLRNS